MLILARKHGQSVLIGDNIKVTVFQNDKTVRIGIDCPTDIEIWRTELLPRSPRSAFASASNALLGQMRLPFEGTTDAPNPPGA